MFYGSIAEYYHKTYKHLDVDPICYPNANDCASVAKEKRLRRHPSPKGGNHGKSKKEITKTKWC
jgi:hypothetical protein